jgi:hypothetical protein
MLDWPNLVANSTLFAVLGYFLKKVDKRIDDTARTVEGIEDRIVARFNVVCEERQEACSALQGERLGHVKHTQSSFCGKLDKLEEQRREDWRHQRAWNEKIEDRLNSKGGAGR